MSVGTFFRGKKNFFSKNILPFLPVFLLIAFFISPVSIAPLNLYENSFEIIHIFAFRLPYDPNLTLDFPFIKNFLWLIYLLPCTAIFIIISFILEKKSSINLKKLCFPLTLASLSVFLFCCAICLATNANCFEWFLNLPFYIYAIFLIALLTQLSFVFYGIYSHRHSNSEYEEFLKMRQKDEVKNPVSKVSSLFTKKGFNAFQNHFTNRVRRLSIKTKFTFVIIGTIIVILLAFMFLILGSYKTMFTEAVSDVGRTQAEQTAAVYDSADGENGKIAAFFDEQSETNKYAETPFERIDIIITGNKESSVYLESWESTVELPDFNVLAYTTTSPKKIDESEKSISAEQAVDYLKRYKNGAYRKSYVFNKANKTCKYIYPVTFGRKAGRKLVGFSIVTYKQQVLMRQYFRTKIFVFTIISAFLYLSVIFSILLADFIFNPLLFLRKNVRKTSHSIEKIMSGSAKNASKALIFSDTIKTNDEIKDLSLEISEMVGLIRGIVPYISFSTLQHAEKVSSGDEKGSTSRDLCFLFTDIRGFTSLCEGLPPKEVVEILNRYLEIETKIILDNGGDVDKFVGDEMMAFFSGPRKEINACKAAMEIRSAMREEQKRAMENGTAYVTIGIGINTGKVTFGPVGASSRRDFTSIGDVVNLAARLESANKAYGSKSIISEAVYQKLRNQFICRELDFITVKGKTEPVRIYEILQQKALASKNNASEKLIEIKELFEKGLQSYRSQKWSEGEKFFTECAGKYNDLPSVVFLDRINHFKSNPPPKNWDGVFKMSVK